MRHALITASMAALLTATSWSPAPRLGHDLTVLAAAMEQKALPQPSVPRSAEQVQPLPRARAAETTGTISATTGAQGMGKAESEARRVTGSVGRTLERMQEMFRPAEP